MDTDWPISLPGIEPVALLGSGGFGQVWSAVQTDLDRRVAVKVGHRPFSNEDDRRRFERECKALGRLSGHPHIIEVHTSGLSNGLPYLVLALIEGGTLAEHGATLGEARLRTVTDQLCQAVDAAHQMEILHRDLKPENVFLQRDGSIVLGDFGIARLGDGNNTASGTITASMAFAAPEVLEGMPPSEAADVYGIGVTVASAAMGHSPFTDDVTTLEAVIAKVMSGDVPSLAPYGISPPFEALLRRAMDRDPARRPNSATALRAELNRLPPVGGAVGGQTSVDPRPSPPPSTTWPSTGTTSGSQPAAVTPVAHAGTGHSTTQPPAGYYGTADHQPPGTPPPGFQVAKPAGGPPAPTERSALFWLALTVGIGLSLGALVVGGAVLFRSGGDTQVVAEPDVVEPDQPAEVAEEEDTSQETQLPLTIPLTGPQISNLTEIPLDDRGIDPLLGAANSPQYCDLRPDITGLTETTAGIYPIDNTADTSLRQVAIRMHRFSTPEQAAAFVASYTAIPCDGWEDTTLFSDGPAALSATIVPSTLTAGDETVTIDRETVSPLGFSVWDRTVLVRQGTDVLKLVYFTLRSAELETATNALLAASLDTLGY